MATSKRINGPYSFLYGFYPLGHQSRDMTVWQDPDTHEGYLVFATDNNANLAIATLNDDYTNTTAIISNFTNVYWEAPGVFHNDGSFYLLLSPQNGWTPTPNLWMSAPSMSVSQARRRPGVATAPTLLGRDWCLSRDVLTWRNT